MPDSEDLVSRIDEAFFAYDGFISAAPEMLSLHLDMLHESVIDAVRSYIAEEGKKA